ncbi:MAG: DUF1365 domain-containing protein [Rhizobiales bacterium]|nr:DUF1365 domain-containing protein [Hyphomicrobiales bacterium]
MRSCLYRGEVVHKRMKPVQHALRYRVSNVFLDVDELEGHSGKLRLFGYNRFNLFSVMDRDHGPGDGTPIAQHVRSLARQMPEGAKAERFFMFCYPRMMGYVFNPLTVYFGYTGDGALCVTIYEVNNTFGGRASYVLPVAPGQTSIHQNCAKEFHVSPFNRVEGSYGFHAAIPSDKISLGILYRDSEGPCLKAYVTGNRQELSDRALLKTIAAFPFMTLKVIAGIHWEAAKLWLKGLRIEPGPLTSHPEVYVGGAEQGHATTHGQAAAARRPHRRSDRPDRRETYSEEPAG